MFILSDNPTFTHVVKVSVPVDGGFEDQTMKVTFRVQDVHRESEHDLGTTEGSTAFLVSLIERMDDLASADGQPLPYSDKVRDKLLQLQFVRSAITRAYFQAVNKAAVGN